MMISNLLKLFIIVYMQKNKVVTFGEIMVRLGAPDYLKLIQSNSLDVSYAGAEANVAVSLLIMEYLQIILLACLKILLQNIALWNCVVIV